MPVPNDPYEILGVGRDATPEQIKAAFKRQARKSHPDNGGSTDAFVRIKAAEIVLMNPHKKKKFDDDGYAEEDAPDNIHSLAINKIATFFINSIDATLDHPTGIRDMDFVMGANLFFDNAIKGALAQIANTQRRLKQYEKVIKRIKTKKEKNLLVDMIKHHTGALHRSITNSNDEIAVAKRAKEILHDYEFDVETAMTASGIYLGSTPPWMR